MKQITQEELHAQTKAKMIENGSIGYLQAKLISQMCHVINTSNLFVALQPYRTFQSSIPHQIACNCVLNYLRRKKLNFTLNCINSETKNKFVSEAQKIVPEEHITGLRNDQDLLRQLLQNEDVKKYELYDDAYGLDFEDLHDITEKCRNEHPELKLPSQQKPASQFQSSPQPKSASQFQSSPQPKSASQFQSSSQPKSASQFQSSSQQKSASQFQSSSQPKSASQFQSSSQQKSASQFQSSSQQKSASQFQSSSQQKSASQFQSSSQQKSTSQSQFGQKALGQSAKSNVQQKDEKQQFKATNQFDQDLNNLGSDDELSSSIDGGTTPIVPQRFQQVAPPPKSDAKSAGSSFSTPSVPSIVSSELSGRMKRSERDSIDLDLGDIDDLIDIE